MEFCCSWSIIHCGQIFEYLVEIGHIWLKIFETSPYSGWHSLSDDPEHASISNSLALCTSILFVPSYIALSLLSNSNLTLLIMLYLLYLPDVAVFGVVVAGHRLQVACHRFLASISGEAMFFGISPPCAEICTIWLIWALIICKKNIPGFPIMFKD